MAYTRHCSEPFIGTYFDRNNRYYRYHPHFTDEPTVSHRCSTLPVARPGEQRSQNLNPKNPVIKPQPYILGLFLWRALEDIYCHHTDGKTEDCWARRSGLPKVTKLTGESSLWLPKGMAWFSSSTALSHTRPGTHCVRLEEPRSEGRVPPFSPLWNGDLTPSTCQALLYGEVGTVTLSCYRWGNWGMGRCLLPKVPQTTWLHCPPLC